MSADQAPTGFLFAPSAALKKRAEPGTRRAADVADDGVEQTTRPTLAEAPPPADLTHGKPVGAGNALAFHQWRKADPTKP